VQWLNEYPFNSVMLPNDNTFVMLLHILNILEDVSWSAGRFISPDIPEF
jgi:hypothetical protein